MSIELIQKSWKTLYKSQKKRSENYSYISKTDGYGWFYIYKNLINYSIERLADD